MKKTIAMIMSVGMMAGISSADIIITDNFSYTGALTANGWIAYSGADLSVTSDGSVASIGSGAEDIRLPFADQTTNPTFASFTLNIQTLPGAGAEYSFGFSDASAMESRFGIVSVGGTGFRLSAYAGGTALLATNSAALSLNTDYVVAIAFDGVSDHRLWIDPGTGDFDTPDIQVSGANNGIDGFFLRQAGSLDAGAASWTIDNLAVGTTFADTVVPEPATMSMVLLGLLGARGMIHRRKRS